MNAELQLVFPHRNSYSFHDVEKSCGDGIAIALLMWFYNFQVLHGQIHHHMRVTF